MHIITKTALLTASAAALVLLSSPAEAQSRYGQSPVAAQKHAPQHAPKGMKFDQYGRPLQAQPKKYKNIFHKMRGQKHISYQQRPPAGMFQQWVEYEREYTLVPGDQVEVAVASAPELSRTLTIGPDGRIVMPMAKPIMAAGRTFGHVQNALMAELATQLRDPRVTVIPRAYAPEQIYVGGQVGQPGTYTIPGRIGALEGILMAGGLRPTARSRDIAILRRAPNGGMMMRSVNIRNGLLNIREYNDNIQLRRGDIIYVPQTTLGEVGTFVQSFRNALPVDFNLSYQFGSNGGGTTVISP